MFSSLLGKIKGGLSGVSGGISSKLSGLGGNIGGNIDSSARFQKGLAGVFNFAEANPSLVGAGTGALGGYAASGSFGGALAGAAAGGIGGRMGWTSYNRKSQSHRMTATRAFAGNFRKGLPQTSRSLGPKTSNMRSYTSPQSGATLMQKEPLSSGVRRRAGSKRIAAHMVGRGMTAGVGILAGGAWGMGSSAIGNAGRTFGAQANSVYGNSFSGMGNGSVTGY